MAHGRDADAVESESTTIGVWALVWTIFVAKLATLVFVLLAAHSFQAAALVSATTWPWLVIAVALAVSPLLFRYRLRRVRAKRRRLLQAEWMLGTDTERSRGI